MSIWLAVNITLLLAAVPCAYIILRTPGFSHSLFGQLTGGAIGLLTLVVLAGVWLRPSFEQVAILLSLLAFGLGIFLVHWMERWLR